MDEQSTVPTIPIDCLKADDADNDKDNDLHVIFSLAEKVIGCCERIEEAKKDNEAMHS